MARGFESCGLLAAEWSDDDLRTLRSLMAVVLCATVAIEAAPAPELSQFWDASDETRRATISRREWQELLDAYLTSHPSGINRFDYGSLHANPKHRAQLASTTG